MEMDLRSQILRVEQSFKPLPPEQAELLKRLVTEVSLSGIAQRVPKAGDQAPDFTLPNAVGLPITLSTALRNGPVIVTFYRGIWCPYCSLQLQAYQKILPQVLQMGASLMAISPQKPDKSQATLLKNFLQYEVLSDIGNVVGRQYGLVYQMPEWVRDLYRSFDVNLPDFNGDESWELPLPGTFVLHGDRRIALSFADPDPRNRLEPQAILEALGALTGSRDAVLGEPL